SGAIVSVLLHVALVVGAVWLSTRPTLQEALPPEVRFFSPPPPPPPPPAGGGAIQGLKKEVVRKTPVKKALVVPVKAVPVEKTPELEPTPEPEPTLETKGEGGVPGGVAGGVPGGVVGGTSGGVVGGVVGGTGTMPFGEGMARPTQLSGRDPQYTREALEARIQGLMIVKCTITLEGTLRDCRVIKPLPHMERAVLDALASRRYTPVTFQGRPVAVDYVFNIRLVLPNR
ncbi:MAG TPA: energy transducer TonB, partial [Myxococcaceae bacterium]|nr:energy transducer TonB [Myxococcaceae bacterium]